MYRLIMLFGIVLIVQAVAQTVPAPVPAPLPPAPDVPVVIAPPATWNSRVLFGNGAVTIQSGPEVSWLMFGKSHIAVNTITGEVKIPPDLPLDDAAKQFWNAVAMIRGQPPVYPEVEKQP
jgi:hypothetical protein